MYIKWLSTFVIGGRSARRTFFHHTMMNMPSFLLGLLLSLLFLTTSSTTKSPTIQKWGLPPPTSTNTTLFTTNSSTNIPTWKARLPLALQTRATLQRIVIPTAPGYYTTVYLLGTSHVSNDSSADVDLLLYSVRPSTSSVLSFCCCI